MQRVTTLILLSAAAACGGAPPPVAQLADSEASIRAAEEAGAGAEPQAALYLKLSKEQLDKAKALMEEDDNEEATIMLQRVVADANLARGIARRVEAEAEADDAAKTLDKLQKKR